MKKGLYARIMIDRQTMSDDMITSWFDMFTVFEPLQMRVSTYKKGKTYKYNSNVFLKEVLKSHFESTRATSSLMNNTANSMESVSITSGYYADNITWLTIKINENTYNISGMQLIQNLRKFIAAHGCIVGYVHSGYDDFMQNNEDIDYYKIYGGDLTKVKYKEDPRFKGEKIIDIEPNPGHSHIGHGIWFGSAWLMWFGQGYFNYIPKQVILAQTYVYSNKAISDDVVEVQLYEKIEDYAKIKNREIQQRFRDELAIDRVAHQLPMTGYIDLTDPLCEIKDVDNQKYLIYYLDKNGELTIKSKSISSTRYLINY